MIVTKAQIRGPVCLSRGYGDGGIVTATGGATGGSVSRFTTEFV